MKPDPVSSKAFNGPRLLRINPTPEKTTSLFNALGSLGNIRCLAREGGTIDVSGKTITTLDELRAAQPKAMKTIVSNTGAQPARVYEGGAMVAVVKAGRMKKLPARGKLQIKAEVVTGSTYLTAITLLRGACGDVTAFLAGDDAPVGEFLL